MTDSLPSLDRLFELFYVDSTSPTGLRNVKTRGPARKDQPAGSVCDAEYSYVGIDRKQFLTHRIIQKMKTGVDSELSVDHKDQNKRNNHPFNLRWADQGAQNRNRPYKNKTGYRGVAYYPHLPYKPYNARVNVNGKQVSLGYYATADEAHAVVLQQEDPK